MKRMIRLSLVFCFYSLISLISLITPRSLFAVSTVRFLYDGDGVRVAKIEEGKTTLYVGDLEKDLNSGEVTKYYSLGGKRIAVKTSPPTGGEGSNLSFIVLDHLGSLRTLSSLSNLGDLNGSSTTKISYYPYGSIRFQTGNPSSRQYTSQINDDSTGLYFYNARYYNPQTANFIQADLAGSSLNKYNYVSNNPIRFLDSSGNDPVDTFALYLCQAERTDCNNLAPEIWGGKDTYGLANKSLDRATALNNVVNKGLVDPKYVATREIPDSLLSEVNSTFEAGNLPDILPTKEGIDSYSIAAMQRAKISGVNIALILSVGLQEDSNLWDWDMTHSHLGNNFIWLESYITRTDKSNGWSPPGQADNGHLMSFIYAARAFAGFTGKAMNSPGLTYSLISPENQINFAILSNYPGEGNYNDIWMTKVQAYYNAFTKFANDYPEEYGWLLNDVTQIGTPHNKFKAE